MLLPGNGVLKLMTLDPSAALRLRESGGQMADAEAGVPGRASQSHRVTCLSALAKKGSKRGWTRSRSNSPRPLLSFSFFHWRRERVSEPGIHNFFGKYHPSRAVQCQTFVAGFEECIYIIFVFLSPFMVYPERPPD